MGSVGGLVRLVGDARAAVVGPAGELSYQELARGARGVGQRLRELGQGPETVVGLQMARSPDLVVAVLGVLEAGAAYAYLDPALPPARRAQLVAGSGITTVVRDVAQLVAGRRPDPGAGAGAEGVRVSPDNLAYVVYTSGTTGPPKPVGISRASLLNHARAMAERYRLTDRDRVLQFANPGFDVFAEEVFPTLLAGAALVVPGEALLAFAELERLIDSRAVTVVNLPSSYWAHWAADLDSARRSPPACLRLVVVGSEVAPTVALARWQRRSPVPVVNAYGLSETTITVAAHDFGPSDQPAAASLPIGRAVAGAGLHVLGADRQPAGVGEPGELYVSGPVLARGYLGRPATTAERFVPGPAGGRLYRTGDLARIDATGSVELLGRGDDQVQVRGHRVEPAEVAAALAAHPDVANAAVLATADASGLVAYLVPRDPRQVPATRDLREHLRARLPQPLVPETYVVLDALPTDAHGKLDRSALPRPSRRRRDTELAPTAPRTDVERRLLTIWQEEVGVDGIGVDDDLFDVGGHSLTALRVVGRIRAAFGVDLSLRELLDHRTVAHLATRLDGLPSAGTSPAAGGPVRSAEPEPWAPLSFQQEQIWFLCRLAPDSIAYHAQTTIRVVGALDLDRLDRALTELARRHEVLRTTYEDLDGVPRQVVHPPAPVRATRLDVSDPAGGPADDRLDHIVGRELQEPFDLAQLPLIRWTAVRLAAHEHELIVVEHHLLHDGWSFAILMRELRALYDGASLPELPIQYRDYARWQRAGAGADADRQRAGLGYWARQLEGVPPALGLPLDRPRPAVQSFRGNTLRVELPVGLSEVLRAFSRDHRVTLFTTMLAGFYALLHRYTGDDDICVGSGFANRQLPRTEGVLGMFVNTVALRADLAGDPSFRDLVVAVSRTVLDAVAHEDVPFGEVVRAVNPSREASLNPLTQVMFSANDSPLPSLELAGARGTIYERGNGSAKVDIDVVVIPRRESQEPGADHVDERITLMWEYVTDLFDRSTMQAMVDTYARLLGDALAHPGKRLSELALLAPTERRRVLTDWNPGAAAPEDLPLVPLAVSDQARRTPEALAVVDTGRSVSYAELLAEAGRLAARLRGRGAGPDRVVGVCLPRSADLVVAELAIMLAGAAYLPLDPEHPPVRLAAQCADAGTGLIVTDQAGATRLPAAIELVRLDHDDEPAEAPTVTEPPPRALAYLISTSGTTGRPKTVMVDHAALANVVWWRRQACHLGPADRTTLISAPAFDGSVADIWPTLVAGGSLHVPDEPTRLDPRRLQAWLVEQRITVTDLPTVLAERLLSLDWPAPCPLRVLVTAGDRLVARPSPTVPFRVVNEYGPTEAAVTATAGDVESAGAGAWPPDIGRPITGVTAYVLDAGRGPVPAGVSGELWLGGLGVARGYAGRPRMTAERFAPDPLSRRPGGRRYRTGDLARHLPDGRLAFLGRADVQIKLRGYRIEPAEVVGALRLHPQVGDAAVVARGDSPADRRLVAYVVARGHSDDLSPRDLRNQLADRLPAYMVPAAFVVLDELPVTRTGKLDERALPAPDTAAPEAEYQEPSSETEQLVAGIWRRVLDRVRVGLDDNFFELGGDSLLSMQVVAIARESGLALQLIDLFEHQTVRRLAAVVAPPSAAAS